MIQVKLRWDGDTEAHDFTEVPFDKLDTVIPMLKAWGVDGEEPPDMYGQFAVPENGPAYFEVVLTSV